MVVEMSFVEIDFQDLEFYETLGRGSAGSVYRGVWRSKEKIVALKKLNLLEDEVRKICFKISMARVGL